jgi:hypothetical protein
MSRIFLNSGTLIVKIFRFYNYIWEVFIANTLTCVLHANSLLSCDIQTNARYSDNDLTGKCREITMFPEKGWNREYLINYKGPGVLAVVKI